MLGRLFGRVKQRDYDVFRLVDCEYRPPLRKSYQAGVHVFCDIDKTYLETQFESVSSLVKIAYESAEAKITVKGAPDVLRALIDDTWEKNGENRFLHFVSSSPPQLRSVLAQNFIPIN